METSLNLTLSKKQSQLLNDIISPNLTEIYVLGSTQSGKTFDICLGCILYAQALYNYNPNETYFGSITGWSLETLKGNILEPLKKFLDDMKLEKGRDYILRWQTDEKYLEIYNIRYYFFGFNNVLAFNKILGKPLIFEWIDESARIYSQDNLREPFNEFPGRQVSYADHPYLKTIHSFNVEGGENHPYKIDYIDKKPYAKHYSFFPYDNPKIKTEEAMRKVLEMFPPGNLREQKIFNRWILATGKVFNTINTIDNLDNYAFREIGIGIDYGSVHATAFVPIALAYDKVNKKWVLIRLEYYYHNAKEEQDNPTTEYFSKQLRLFLLYLKSEYGQVPITTIVLDSAAAHFHNRLIELGCTPQKSLTLKFPNKNIFAEESLVRHFIRGYVDGDGCLSYTKTGRLVVEIIGTKEFLEEIISLYPSYFKRTFHKDKRRPSSNTYFITCSCNNADKFASILYDKSSIYLDRKYERFAVLRRNS